VFKSLGPFAFVEGLIFIGILVVGLAYVWKKGDLEWVKPEDISAMKPQRWLCATGGGSAIAAVRFDSFLRQHGGSRRLLGPALRASNPFRR